MSDVISDQDHSGSRRLRLSTRISGAIFWGAVLTGIVVVAVFIKQNENDFIERQDHQALMLLRVVEATVAPQIAASGFADKSKELQQAIDALGDDNGLMGVQIQLGSEKILIGSIPENALIKTTLSNLVIDPNQNQKMVVTAYFSSVSANLDSTRKNLIILLGVISFAFGLIMNRILQKMLTNPIDHMIETAAAYAKGDKLVRFDDHKDDEFGFLSRFINMALNASETMQQQLETSVHEQRAAKEGAEQALKELESTQERLVQSEKLASLGQLTAGIAHEIKNPLNFINNFSETSVELIAELNETIAPHLQKLDADVRGEVSDILADLSTDLETIAKHGKRADSIVKNMLMHSRSDGGEAVPTDINALVSEALGLAYHGERATDRDFQIEMISDFAENLKQLEVVPQDITRVLINLFSNAFYATKKRRSNGAEENYVPTLTTTSRAVNDGIEIRIRDNGVGISNANLKTLFTPFFTTKPTGQGTGLGLSISHDIIVKQNNGRLDVVSKENEFTEFMIWLPNAPHNDTTNE